MLHRNDSLKRKGRRSTKDKAIQADMETLKLEECVLFLEYMAFRCATEVTGVVGCLGRVYVVHIWVHARMCIYMCMYVCIRGYLNGRMI